MKFRLKLVIGLFVVAGIAAATISSKTYEEKTEEWMEASIPEELPGYQFSTSSRSNEAAKMDDNTYQILKPFGIVVRQFVGPSDGRYYEATVIGGNTRKSFHDPQICFSAQQWALIDPGKREVDIPALGGKIPATTMALERSGTRGVAMYFYGGPGGWRHSPLILPIDLTMAKLLMKDSIDAQFFRFIMSPATQPDSASPEDVEKALLADLATLSKFADVFFTELKKQPDGAYYTQH